jgi:hypothetical protein
MKPVWFVVLAVTMLAQAPPPQPTMKQLMLDLIHPAANDILLFVNRGAPKNEQEWAVVRRGGLTLAESGNLLIMPGRAREGDWTKDAKILADVGNSAYQAAQAKDFPALAALADALDASCTTCHKQYRPNVFPKPGGATGGSK